MLSGFIKTEHYISTSILTVQNRNARKNNINIWLKTFGFGVTTRAMEIFA